MRPRKPNEISGHRWMQARRRVLRAESVCAECGQAVDKTLPWLDPMAAQVDHKQPVALGGDPFARANLQLMHRRCNLAKGVRSSMVPVRTPTSRRW